MASRNGLNPKIKGPKGVVFGRALPSAFGFDNGFKPDGQDDYFTIPRLIGTYTNYPICFEFWVKPTSGAVCSFAGVKWNYELANVRFNVDKRGVGSQAGGVDLSLISTTDGSLHHVMCYADFVNHVMGQIVNASTSGIYRVMLSESSSQLQLNNTVANVFVACDVSTSEPSANQMDEFRMYNTIMPYNEVVTNYNAGIGANPSRTENLICWFKFEKFEMLDFSADQDGSDMRLGMRDFSGKNNHGLPHNMITDPANTDYVLKPFN